MRLYNKTFIFLLSLIFRFYQALANENGNCDCPTLQLISEGTNTSRNLTKQSNKINGQPFYFSEIKDILWWNDTSDTWEFQTYLESLDTYLPIFQSEKNFSCLNSSNKADETFAQFSDIGVIKAKCLAKPVKCVGIQEESGEIDQYHDGTYIIPFNATIKVPCVFPFKYGDQIYYHCTKVKVDKFWCATYVDDELEMKDWGHCSELCPKSLEVTNNLSTILIVTISIFTISILSSTIMIYYCYAKRNKKKQEKQEKDTLLVENIPMTNSNVILNEQNEYSSSVLYKNETDIVLERQASTIKYGDPTLIDPDLILNEQATHLSYSGKCEIDQSDFEVGQILAGGNFGTVSRGTANDPTNPEQRIKVAVKTVNNPLDLSQLYALMCEIKVLDKLDQHLNLVNMVGACTTDFRDGRLWLVLEFCPLGDMKRFLLKNKATIRQNLSGQAPINELNDRLFIKWAHGISKGMEYLSSMRIMHGDLAARNILIGVHGSTDESYVSKITDFGLSRAFYDKTSYVKQERDQIPWKWMDIHFLETGIFTMTSDVWSFGIVLWEMLSLGKLPYAGTTAKETIDNLNAGFRLPVPDEIHQVKSLVTLYQDATKWCWQFDPKQRWTFTELVEYFETYLKPIEKEERKRLEDKYVEMQNIVKIDTPMSKTLNSIPIPATEITHESEMQSAIQSSAQFSSEEVAINEKIVGKTIESEYKQPVEATPKDVSDSEVTYYGRDGYKASVQCQNMESVEPAQGNVGLANEIASKGGYITLLEKT